MTSNKNFCENLQAVPTEFPTSPVGIHIGHQLRKLRVLFGLSPDQVANAAGLDPIKLLEYESGVDAPACELWQISQVFNIRPDFFFSGMSENTRQQCWKDLTLRVLKGMKYKIPEDRELTTEESIRLFNMLCLENDTDTKIN